MSSGKKKFKSEGYRQALLNNYFLLDGENVVYPCEDLTLWQKGMAELSVSGRKTIAYTSIDGMFVSTIFLGINKNMNNAYPPLVFESMIAGKTRDIEVDPTYFYYSDYKEAMDGHTVACDITRTRLERNNDN